MMLKTFRYALQSLGPIDARSIVRDPMLAWFIAIPVAVGLGLRWLTPVLLAGGQAAFGFDFSPYLPVFVAFALLLMTPLIYAVVVGFLLLDERDANTLIALQVTPMPLASYLAYRLMVPVLLSLVMTPVAVTLSGLVQVELGALLASSLAAACVAPVFTLFFATFAGNKVEGFALQKAMGPVLMTPLATPFLPEPWEYLVGIVPTYWPAKLFLVLVEGGQHAWVFGLVGVVYCGLLTWLLTRRLSALLHRTGH